MSSKSRYPESHKRRRTKGYRKQRRRDGEKRGADVVVQLGRFDLVPKSEGDAFDPVVKRFLIGATLVGLVIMYFVLRSATTNG